MKRFIVFLFLITFVTTAFAQNEVKQNRYEFENHPEKLTISHLVNDYYVFTTCKVFKGSRYPSNGMYVVTNDGIVLIDMPWDQTQFQPLLDSIVRRHNKKVILAIATHYHDDRTAGFDFYKNQGIKTYSSKQTFDLCKKFNQKQAGFYFTKDTTFTIGNKNFQIYYPGKGHTEDNIVIWCNNEKVLYGGCLVKSIENNGLGNIADADLMEWPLSVKRVMNKFSNHRYVVTGHFSWKSNMSLEHTLKLLQDHQIEGVR